MSRTKTADIVEQFFREHRYESFTQQDLFMRFPETKFEVIRNAVARLSRDRVLKSTGMVRHSEKFAQPVPIGDVFCLTLTIGK